MTARQFERWLRTMGYGTMEASRALGCGRNSIANWRASGAPEYIDHACANIAGERPPWSRSQVTRRARPAVAADQNR